MKITGEVIHGDKYGRTLGFPTANIESSDYHTQDAQLEYGIYGGFVEVGELTHLAGIVIGPEDVQGLPRLEAYLVDYSGDLYGKVVTFHVLKYIRAFEKYNSEQALKEAIEEDVVVIKEMNLCLPE
jgi:FAD synthase